MATARRVKLILCSMAKIRIAEKNRRLSFYEIFLIT
ncbi:hypothetical protein ES703_65734 [subsurface metagenome]